MSAKTWTPPDAQTLYDNACLGIIGQGMQACMDAIYGCLAMSADGKRRCAIAWSCTDVEPGKLTSKQWARLAKDNLAADVRDAHDDTLVNEGPDAWRTRMAEIAIEHGLDDSCLWFTLADARSHRFEPRRV